MLAAKKSARQYQIGEREQSVQLRRILRQAAIAGLAMLEQAFDNVKAMFNFGAHARFGLLQLFFQSVELVFLEGFAYARAHGRMPNNA